MSYIDRTILKKRNEKLFGQMVKADSLKPTFTLAKLFAFLIALIVHGVALLFLVVAVYLLISALRAWTQGYSGYFFVLLIITIIFGILAFALRPRINPMPLHILSRTYLDVTQLGLSR